MNLLRKLIGIIAAIAIGAGIAFIPDSIFIILSKALCYVLLAFAISIAIM